MIELEVPSRGTLRISKVVLDYNGTIAVDGAPARGVGERIRHLSRAVEDVIIVTADTYGTVAHACLGLPVRVITFPSGEAAGEKARIVRSLGGEVCCMGNGHNDRLMFDVAELSIAVMDVEGMSASLLSHADILARSASEALDLLLDVDRIRATLRG